MADRLAGKIALVIGAAGGIGRSIALRFAAEGASVIATGTSGREQNLSNECPERIEPLHCDVSDPGSPSQAVEHVMTNHGRLDVVVNNAGIGIGRKRIHEVDLDEWQRLMDVNLRGAFLVMKAALPAMIKSGGGSLITIASTASYRATPLVAAYCASKGGVLQLTRAAALEYVDDGIRVNAICPGTVQTPLLDRHPPEFIAQLACRVPMGRLGNPEEIASLALFLASDEASYITGQGYLIDGGRFAG